MRTSVGAPTSKNTNPHTNTAVRPQRHICEGAGAGQNADSIARANAVAGNNGIPWQLPAAVGVRESRFINQKQSGGGLGRGIFQIDRGVHPEVSNAQAYNVARSAKYAAADLAEGIAEYGSYNPALSNAIGARYYNAGGKYMIGKIAGGIPALDRGTAPPKGNDYVSNVLGLMDCFH